MLNAINKNNIIFIGFMGSGKSMVGRAISKKFGKLFLDTDSIIENREDKKIIDIFKDDGENYFRDLERESAKFIKRSVRNSIISVGGGFPTAVNNLQDLGFVIYLNIDFDFMVSELGKYEGEMEKRPLMQNIESAKKIYDSRKTIYSSQADFIVNISKESNFQNTLSEIETYIVENLL